MAGETIDPALAAAVAGAFARWLPPGPVAVCRDTRPTGPALAGAVVAGLAAAGRDVRDLGVVPVPTLQVYVKEERLAGGIDVTASHNPIEWNALKFVGPGGYFLTREESADLRRRFEEAGPAWTAWDRQGRVVADSTAVRRHVDRIVRAVEAGAIRRRRFRVAIDCVNGAASRATPVLLEALGCSVAAIHDDPDAGRFPHDPEPRAEHLGDLARLVRETGADVGFAQDPDADRLALVDERGTPLSEEYTQVLAADVVLGRSPGRPAVTNLSASRMFDDVAARHGAPVLRTRIGEINVSVRLREAGGVVGGEGNGGVIYPPVHEGRDSLAGIALVLEGLAARGGRLSDWIASIPSYAMVKEKVPVGGADVGPAVEAVRRALGASDPPPLDVNLDDGVKISWADRWVHLRASNTEPVVRIMAEAPTRAEADDLARRAREAIRA